MASPSYEGTILGDTYELEGRIGQGQMGVVYRASHTRLPRTFAIKILNANLAAEPEHRMRFENEAEIACKVGGDHVVEVFDINTTPEGMLYIVMELLEGQDLAAHMKAAGTLRLGETVTILNQVSEALEATHERGVIHRDLKPSNIFLCKDADRQDVVKVLDFGVAKLKNSGFRTETGIMIGSPSYMAPEQARPGSASISPQTDIWALGVILYQCIAGVRPFAKATLEDTLSALCFEEPTPLRKLVPDVSPRVEEVILKALSKEPAARHAHAGALRAEFAAACEDAWENRVGKGQVPVRPAAEKFPIENATTVKHSEDPSVGAKPASKQSPDGTKVMRKAAPKAAPKQSPDETKVVRKSAPEVAPEAALNVAPEAAPEVAETLPMGLANNPAGEREKNTANRGDDRHSEESNDNDETIRRGESSAEILQYNPTVAPASAGGRSSLRSRRSKYMIGVGLTLSAAVVFALVLGAEPDAKPTVLPDSEKSVIQEPGIIAAPDATQTTALTMQPAVILDAGSRESDKPLAAPKPGEDAAQASDAVHKPDVSIPSKKPKKRFPKKVKPDTTKEWDPNSLSLPEG